MRKHPVLVAGAAAVVALALTWWLSPNLRAQVGSIYPGSFNGQETWSVGLQGAQGTSEFVTSGMMRNTTGITTTATTSGTIAWPGFSGAFGAQFSTIVWTAASVSATINLPAKPFDGQEVELINGSGGSFTQLTVAVTDGATLHGTATTGALTDGSSVEWRYSLANTTWYRLR